MYLEKIRKTFSHFDWPFTLVVLALVLIGLLNLYSSTYNLTIAKYFKAQVMWTSVGLVVALLVALIDYRIWSRLAYPAYLGCLGMLMFVLVFGKVSQGSQRWIIVGGFALQPSELAKIGLLVCLAQFFSKRKDIRPMNVLDLAFPTLLVLMPFLLILQQPDLGTSLILVCTAAVIFLFIGVQRKIIITLLALFIALAPLGWKFGLRPYQKDRVISFLNPEKFPLSKGYQVIQSKIAIGSGELLGKGFLKGTQSKLQFLPKQHTDFVFSNFAEEFGFLGSIVLLGLYVAFGALGFNIAFGARDMFGVLLALGATVLILTQAIINLGMEVGLLPVVGMTLPLFSYGGSSLLTTFIAVGLILNVSMRRYMF